MPGLSESEIKKIVDRYIGVSNGYLGDFTHRTHESFYPEYCGLEINPDDYQRPQDENRTPIRKRFIAILKDSCPQTQAKIVRGVLQRFPVNISDKTPITRTKELYEELIILAKYLENIPEYIPVEPDTTIAQELFISYTWGGQGEELAELLDKTFQARGVIIVRDKTSLGYKGNIKEFMERLGRGKCVIAVICDKYLRSRSCMFELLQVAENGDFHDRIFPIVISDAKLHDPVERLEYVRYWEIEKEKLNNAMKTVSAEDLQGFRDDIDLYAKIRGTIAELTNILKNMNTLTVEIHSGSNFNELFTSINNKLSE